jgi:hypothetical protein
MVPQNPDTSGSIQEVFEVRLHGNAAQLPGSKVFSIDAFEKGPL